MTSAAITTHDPAGAEYESFCLVVRKHSGLDLSAYKRNQMERRIRAMSERVGAVSLQDFWRILTRDQAAMQDFLGRVTINVTEFFRNPEKFEDLRQYVLPELLRRHPQLTIWSAGCSLGSEPYSVAMLLREISHGSAHRIIATDLDSAVLDRARQGLYHAEEIKTVSANLLKKHFTPTPDGYQITPALQTMVTFKRHDLLRDECPQGMDLILCRNVIIYFADEAKQRLFRQFYQALRPGGYLLVGSTERVMDAGAIGFLSPRPFFYQKPLQPQV